MRAPIAPRVERPALTPEQLLAVLEATADALTVQGPDGRLLYANPAAAAMCGYGSPAELLAASPDELAGRWQLSDANGRPLPLTSLPGRIVLQGGSPDPVTICYRTLPDGRDRWTRVSATAMHTSDGATYAINSFHDVSAEHEAAAALGLSASRARLLAEATRLLASSLDIDETIRRLAELAVPGIADWCVIELLDETGQLRPVAITHANPARVALATELRRRYPPDRAGQRGPYAVIRSGQPDVAMIRPEDLRAAARDAEHLRLIEELELHSYMSVPLVAGGEVLGVVSFVGAESGRTFDREDVLFAEDLAGRAAASIQNARLYRDAERLRLVLDATRESVNIFDPETLRILYVNDGALEQLGRARDELIGMTPVAFTEDLTEEQLRELIAPLVDGSMRSRTVTLTRIRADGVRIPVDVMWQYIETPDEGGRIVGIARDISQRLDAERRLAALAATEHARAAELDAVIRALGEGVVVCDEGGGVILANPAAVAMFPDIRSMSYADLIARFDDGARQAPTLGTASDPVELHLSGTVDGWVEMTNYPVHPRGGGSTGETIIMIRDIREARERQAVRDTFIGMLSHELRTPVTTIYAGAKVLARGSATLSDSARQGIFEDIHAEAERLHRLVEDVVALTRFGEGAGEIGNEPVLVQRVIPSVVRSEEHRWPGVRFQLEHPADLPPVAADPTYVEQVVRNLLSNAAKYGGENARVDVLAEAAGDEVIVRVLDCGPGFPADDADHLFELFYRSPATAGVAGGAGIGLYVCSRLVRAMHGRIWAANRPEGGAEFGFALRAMHDDG